MSFDVQGGGTDLVFPHHEMSAVQAGALTGEWPFARALRPPGDGRPGRREDEQVQGQPGPGLAAARATASTRWPIRLVLLSHHYATPWFWSQDELGGRAGAPGPLAGGGRGRRAGPDAAADAGRRAGGAGRRPGRTAPRWPRSTDGLRHNRIRPTSGEDLARTRPTWSGVRPTPCSGVAL